MFSGCPAQLHIALRSKYSWQHITLIPGYALPNLAVPLRFLALIIWYPILASQGPRYINSIFNLTKTWVFPPPPLSPGVTPVTANRLLLWVQHSFMATVRHFQRIWTRRRLLGHQHRSCQQCICGDGAVFGWVVMANKTYLRLDLMKNLGRGRWAFASIELMRGLDSSSVGSSYTHYFIEVMSRFCDG